MHFERQAHIKAQSKTQIAALLFDKVSTKVPAKYFKYNNIFLIENVVKLSDNTKINEYTIKLKEGK